MPGCPAYAHAHSGEAASAAYLALGHAYLADHRYPDAIASFQKANDSGKTLDDYADFLAAQAEMEAGKLSDAEALLTGFAAKYPESIFVTRLPVMIANLSHPAERSPDGIAGTSSACGGPHCGSRRLSIGAGAG